MATDNRGNIGKSVLLRYKTYNTTTTRNFIKSILPSLAIELIRIIRHNSKKLKNKIHFFFESYKKVILNDYSKENINKNMYIDELFNASYKKSSHFVGLRALPVSPNLSCPKIISFYLPQFHPFPENDKWWGRGFTEWSNVTRAVPLFLGHNQPQLPIDVGFYDLRCMEVMDRQIELAKLYNIFGFCFHYYWFSGKYLMETPIYNFLKNKELSLPFCLNWANESWSRRWDGSEKDVLMKQTLKPDDDNLFFNDLLPFINDNRYIKIDDKPLLLIYKPKKWGKKRVVELTDNLRKYSRESGFPDIYLAACLSDGFDMDPHSWGFDACVEFPPNDFYFKGHKTCVDFIDRNFTGSIYDMEEFVESRKYTSPSPYTIFKTAFPGWDNTARMGSNAQIFHNSTPSLYKRWLQNNLTYASNFNKLSEQYVFINAWNEWAEGAHLEPDRKYGYAFLEATATATEEFDSRQSLINENLA